MIFEASSLGKHQCVYKACRTKDRNVGKNTKNNIIHVIMVVAKAYFIGTPFTYLTSSRCKSDIILLHWP